MFFNDYIGPNEEIKFVGNYDRNKIIINPGSNDNSGSNGLPVEITGICGLGFINTSYYSIESRLPNSVRFLFEQYSLASIDTNNGKNIFLGNCVWEGSYPNNIGNFTSLSIFCFGVSAATGIYTGMLKVVIDYSNINRIIYFIGPKAIN